MRTAIRNGSEEREGGQQQMRNTNSAALSSDELRIKRSWKDKTFFVVCKQFIRNKTALVGLVIIFLMIIMGIVAPLIAPYSPIAIDPRNANQGVSSAHLFGTDQFGRDVLSRIIYGARVSIAIGFGASGLGVLVGVILGSIAGFFGGVVETLILRLCDIIQSIPNTLLCIIVSQTLGSSFGATLVALSLYTIPEVTRILRSSMMSIRGQEFVEACKAINCSDLRTMVLHVLPNSLSPVIVTFSVGVGMKIMTSASLSFLGLGIQEPTAEWGAMISAARANMRYAPNAVLFPGLFVAITVLAFNFVGDGLRDALDPKLRR